MVHETTASANSRKISGGSAWLDSAREALEVDGYFIVERVFGEEFLSRTRRAMYETQDRIHDEVGPDRLERAGEIGVLRLMMRHHRHFFEFLEVPEVLTLVDAVLSPTAILHLQNGFILPSQRTEETPRVFQNQFHMDFPRVLNGSVVSLNLMVCIDDFSEENGGTLVVPGSHQRLERPEPSELARSAIPVCCPAGSIVAFDSTLWHAAGVNRSGRDRLAINHQFTRSYIKQQIDYVRALGESTILTLPDRSRQLLGYYTRVPTSLDEFYQPEEKRLYRPNQG